MAPRTIRKYLINGERLTVAEACKKYDMPYQTVHGRVNRNGGDLQAAIERPVGKAPEANPTPEWQRLKRKPMKEHEAEQFLTLHLGENGIYD